MAGIVADSVRKSQYPVSSNNNRKWKIFVKRIGTRSIRHPCVRCAGKSTFKTCDLVTLQHRSFSNTRSTVYKYPARVSALVYLRASGPECQHADMPSIRTTDFNALITCSPVLSSTFHSVLLSFLAIRLGSFGVSPLTAETLFPHVRQR